MSTYRPQAPPPRHHVGEFWCGSQKETGYAPVLWKVYFEPPQGNHPGGFYVRGDTEQGPAMYLGTLRELRQGLPVVLTLAEQYAQAHGFAPEERRTEDPEELLAEFSRRLEAATDPTTSSGRVYR